MNIVSILALFLCFVSLGIAKDEVIADMTCLAEPGTESEFGTYQAWEGEFFPGIPHIKYEIRLGCCHNNGFPAEIWTCSCHHELELARIYGMLGNIDANTGDAQTGWDTDQFLTDIGEATLVMLTVVKNGGLAPGGFNFDAKLRRESVDVEDLFIAHISGMDTLARGLRNAAKLLQDGTLPELVAKRYESFNSKIGALIEEGKISFEELEQKATEWGEPPLTSGKQELAEMIFQSYL